MEKDIPTYSDKDFEQYMQELIKDRSWNLKDQVENMERREKIIVKKIKKTLMVTCPYSSAKGKKNRDIIKFFFFFRIFVFIFYLIIIQNI